MTRLGLLLVLIATGLPLSAQQSAPAFDVASIKENKQPEGPSSLRRTPDGALLAQRFRARFLITIAYRLEPFQLVGVPQWTNETYYDINAKPAAGSSTTRDDMADMLRALLVERFRLAYHREMRPVDGFALVSVKRGVMGPGLKLSAVDCEKPPLARECRGAPGAPNTFRLPGARMWSLIQQLVSQVNAPVIDETGLSATYDFDLRWSADPTATDDLPSLFTALQEQLGLKLERRRTNAEFFVVDRFERPTPD